MAKFEFLVRLTVGQGPYTFNLKFLPSCGGEVIIQREDLPNVIYNEEGIAIGQNSPVGTIANVSNILSSNNMLTFNTVNPLHKISVNYDPYQCPGDKVGTMEVEVNGAVCSTKALYEIPNTCGDRNVFITPGLRLKTTQTFTAVPSGMSSPFAYLWQVNNGAQIISGQEQNTVEVLLPLDDFELTVTVLDSRRCPHTTTILVPASGFEVSLLDFSVARRCDSAPTDPIAIDLHQLINTSLDGVNLNSFQLITAPTKGNITFDPITGVLTYVPNVGAEDQDNFSWNIFSNGGVVSNTSNIQIQLDPCIGEINAVNDNINVQCNTPTEINILDNDTSDSPILPGSLEILTPPFRGSYLILPNGRIRYTPNQDYFGPDIIRYKVSNADGVTSQFASVAINVIGCCSDYSFLTIECVANCLKAVPSGYFLGGSVSDVISRSVDNVTYAVDDEFCPPALNCTDFDSYAWTQQTLGDPLRPMGAGSELTFIRLTGNVYKVIFDLANSNTLFSNLYLQLMAAPGDIVHWDDGTNNFYFKKKNMGEIEVIDGRYYRFNYLINPSANPCGAEFDALTAATQALVIAEDPVPLSNAVGMLLINRTYNPVRTIYFRRVITRASCPTITTILKVDYTRETDPCSSAAFAVTVVEGTPPSTPPVTPACNNAYDLAATNVTSVTSLIGDFGTENFGPIAVPAGLVALKNAIDSILAANGGGTATVLYSNDTLIIQIRNACAVVLNLGTNDGNKNFVPIEFLV